MLLVDATRDRDRCGKGRAYMDRGDTSRPQCVHHLALSQNVSVSRKPEGHGSSKNGDKTLVCTIAPTYRLPCCILKMAWKWVDGSSDASVPRRSGFAEALTSCPIPQGSLGVDIGFDTGTVLPALLGGPG